MGFNLAAFEAGWQSQVKASLEALQKRYRGKGRKDALALRIERALSEGGRPAEGSGTGGPGAVAGSMRAESRGEGFRLEKEQARADEGRDFQLNGLVYHDEEEGEFGREGGGTPKMSWGSRLHGGFQRLFPRGKTASGDLSKWLVVVFLIILAAVLLYFSLPLAKELIQ